MNAEQLYALLPAVHRIADEQAGSPLRAFIELFAREFDGLSESLDQLYDDQFIETCAPWAAPYIGELIGWRPIRDDVSPELAGLHSPRAEIGNTIALRRRKGTALMLEELARNITGWPAHAVECFEQLATTQHMNHVRLHARASATLRPLPPSLARGAEAGAFNTLSHTVDVRRPGGLPTGRHEGATRFNIPNVSLLLWRVQPQRLRDLPLVADPTDATGARFLMHPLTWPTALFHQPLPEDDLRQLAGPEHVPARLTIRGLARAWRAAQAGGGTVLVGPDYGAGRSLLLTRVGGALPLLGAGVRLRAADLRDTATGWAHEGELDADDIAIDPERGRVLLGASHAAQQAADPLHASFTYGLLRDIGGGPYARDPDGEDLAEQHSTSGEVPWQPLLDGLPATSARVLIADSRAHAETPTLRVPAQANPLAAGHVRVLSAAEGTRPVLLAGGDIPLEIGARGALVLEGLLVSGGALVAAAAGDSAQRRLVLRDCTVLEGIRIEDPTLTLEIERCICGPLAVHAQAEVHVRDSVLRAAASDASAYAAPGGGFGAPLTLERSTVIGRVEAVTMPLASDTIFHATGATPVHVQRRQEGCVRYSWLPEGAVTPRRHRCLPDDANPDVLPQFASLALHEPLFASLARASGALFTGASNGGEIGVMNALQQPLREQNLRVRLQEYLRFGLAAGLIHAS